MIENKFNKIEIILKNNKTNIYYRITNFYEDSKTINFTYEEILNRNLSGTEYTISINNITIFKDKIMGYTLTNIQKVSGDEVND